MTAMESKKIELRDVLHLYIGCECDFQTSGTDHRRGILTADLLAHSQKTFGILVKPLLSKLSDMTEEDAWGVITMQFPELSKIDADGEDNSWVEIDSDCVSFNFRYNPQDEEMEAQHVFFDMLGADQFLFLLRKGYDLYNLVESGEAIDRNK